MLKKNASKAIGALRSQGPTGCVGGLKAKLVNETPRDQSWLYGELVCVSIEEDEEAPHISNTPKQNINKFVKTTRK